PPHAREVLQLDFDATREKTVGSRGFDDRERARSVAPCSHRDAQLVDAHLPTVEGKHHRKARWAAVRGRVLRDKVDLSLGNEISKTSERRIPLEEVLMHGPSCAHLR